MSSKEWTTWQVKTLRKMYADGASVEDVAARIGKTQLACYKKAGRLSIKVARGNEGEAYDRGYAARIAGLEKRPPYSISLGYWRWLAGWHDADMAKGVSYIEQLRSKTA